MIHRLENKGDDVAIAIDMKPNDYIHGGKLFLQFTVLDTLPYRVLMKSDLLDNCPHFYSGYELIHVVGYNTQRPIERNSGSFDWTFDHNKGFLEWGEHVYVVHCSLSTSDTYVK
mmetsp:Transcript_10532/g.17222  ORF Transcript_10532/g.17222 Transcript_10532/m.17222 type:complete len:114 (+) Transcript_10532:55-396(+)